MAQRYLRHINTGEIFPYNEHLARHTELVECDPPVVAAPPLHTPRAKRASLAPGAPATAVDTPATPAVTTAADVLSELSGVIGDQ